MLDGFELPLFACGVISTITAFIYSVARGTKSADRFTHRMLAVSIGLLVMSGILRGLQNPERQFAMVSSVAAIACAFAMVISAERSRRRYYSP